MDKKTTRRNRLQLYIDQECGSNTSEFARRVKRSSQQIVDMLKGRKSFGEKVAAHFCEMLGLTNGWFDSEESNSDGLTEEERNLIGQLKKLSPEDRAKVMNLANGLVDIQEITQSVQKIRSEETREAREA
jgi:hypothetical protein